MALLSHNLPPPQGDDYMDVVGRATQEAKAEGWEERSEGPGVK